MTDRPPLSPQFTNELVREKLTALLHAHGIYELGNYGWKGLDIYDDEMIGHAMWQTDSLYSRFLDAHFAATYGHGPVPPVLEPWQQFLVTSGGDFEGLMEAARLSIGLTLFQHEATERDHYAIDSFFQVHLISSMVLLGAASDRLRDLFIAAVFQISTDQYVGTRSEKNDLDKKDALNPKWYNAPFNEAAHLAVANIPHGSRSFAALPALAERMYNFRKARNGVVHVVATELGRQQRDLAKKSVPDLADENFSYEDIQTYQKQADAEHRERVNCDLNRLVLWYKLLIDMSNDVFIVENRLRRQNPY